MGPQSPQGDEHEPRPQPVESMWLAPVQELGPDAIAFAEGLRRALELEALIAASPLVGIVPVARAVSIEGVVVEMLALELRAAGVRAWLRFASADPPRAAVGHPVAAAHDAEGTAYETMTQLRARFGSRGDAEVLVMPGPPAAVSALTVSVTRFVVPPGPPPPAPQPPVEALEGPWEFVIELGR
jgi:hypothetical protein